MAFCPNCGAQVPDNAGFCGNCGQKINVTENKVVNPGAGAQEQTPVAAPNPAQQAGAAQQANAGANVNAAANEAMNKAKDFISNNKDNNKLKMGLILGGVGIIAIILIVVIAVNHKATLNLNDYVEVTYSGYETAGTASVNFDWDLFESDLQDKAKVKKSSSKLGQLAGLLTDNEYAVAALAESSVDYSLTPSEGLSNGDKINLVWNVNDALLQKTYKVKLKCKDKELTVDGLDQPIEVDPFAELLVTFEGVAPDIYVNVENQSTDSVVQQLYYSVNAPENISVGDTVTVSIDEDADYYLTYYGYLFTQTSKEYTCDGVDEYVTTLADIPADMVSSLQTQTQEVLTSYIANNADEFVASGWNYEGMYFMTPKSSDSWGDQNNLIVIYSTTIQSVEGTFNPVVIYFPVEYYNLLKHADGSVDCDLTYYNTLGNFSDFDTLDTWDYYSIRGYGDKAKMYNELVTTQIGDYSVEVSAEAQQ